MRPPLDKSSFIEGETNRIHSLFIYIFNLQLFKVQQFLKEIFFTELWLHIREILVEKPLNPTGNFTMHKKSKRSVQTHCIKMKWSHFHAQNHKDVVKMIFFNHFLTISFKTSWIWSNNLLTNWYVFLSFILII